MKTKIRAPNFGSLACSSPYVRGINTFRTNFFEVTADDFCGSPWDFSLNWVFSIPQLLEPDKKSPQAKNRRRRTAIFFGALFFRGGKKNCSGFGLGGAQPKKCWSGWTLTPPWIAHNLNPLQGFFFAGTPKQFFGHHAMV